MLTAIRCFFTSHDPERHYLGGFRCKDCGKAGASLYDLGFDGFVSPLRRLFNREDGGVTRTTSWDAPSRPRPVPFPSRIEVEADPVRQARKVG